MRVVAENTVANGLPAGEEDRVAVIDIGSNSIRLEIFDGLTRAFCPLFNEKVLCGLGRGLKTTGRLSKEGMHLALINLPRFTRMARGMGVARIDMLATAAAREAENGKEFIAEVEHRCGQKVKVISGKEEARISALGVLAGIPNADGVMGDLGGGSLELVEIVNGKQRKAVTLSLGTLRLLDLAMEGDDAVRHEIDGQLAGIDWLARLRDRCFYAVGGAWRNIARIHMDQVDYPLRMIQGYSLTRRDARDFARVVSRLSSRSLVDLSGIARRRQEVLPYAAVLLRRILKTYSPDGVVFSAYGLREGFIFDQLPAKERGKDPLLAAAAAFGAREGRFGDLGDLLAAWTGPLFPEEDAAQLRLRRAVCHLSDLAWREHSDYRAGQAVYRLLHHPFSGLDHQGRAFIAYAVFNRYGGGPKAPEVSAARALLTSEALARARSLGLALRLAYRLTAGTRALLESTSLVIVDGKLRLVLPSDGSVPYGEAVENRYKALAEACDAEPGGIVVP